MNTNIKVELTEDERRQIARYMFGSNKQVTRRELTMLVEQCVGHMINGVTDERMPDVQTLQPQPALEQHAGVHAERVPVHTEPCPPGANPKEWRDPGYRRAWYAVGKITRRMR